MLSKNKQQYKNRTVKKKTVKNYNTKKLLYVAPDISGSSLTPSLLLVHTIIYYSILH